MSTREEWLLQRGRAGEDSRSGLGTVSSESTKGGETALFSPTRASHRKAGVLSEAWRALARPSDPPQMPTPCEGYTLPNLCHISLS